MVRDSFNPLAPEPVEVECDVCGHRWETTAQNPLCSDPVTTKISCNRSSRWSYVDDANTERAKRVRAELDSEIEDEQSDDDIDEFGESDQPDHPEESGETAENAEGEVEPDYPDENANQTETMVTQEEYEQAHAEDTEDEGTEDDEPTELPGIPVPGLDTQTVAMLVIVLIAIVGLWWVMNRRATGSSEPRPEPEPEPVETMQVEESPESGDAMQVHAPGETPNRRSNNEIPLFES